MDYRLKSIINKPKNYIEVAGYKYFLDPRNSITKGDFDDNVEIKLVEDFVRPGDVFVDVGASIGLFTVMASLKAGNVGKVFAFEPDVKSYNLLLKNLKENGCSNVIAENIAVSDSVGENSFYTIGDVWQGSTLINPKSDPDFYINRILSDYEDKTIRESKVKMTTLDAYLGDQRIDYIKTDTEGNEGHVFRGMQNVIKRNPSIIIYMEFAPVLLKKFGTDPDELINDIKKLGFKIFVTDGKRLGLFENTNFSGNIFFTRRDIGEKIYSLMM